MKVKLVSTMALLVMLVLSRGSSVSGRALSAQPLDPLLPVPVLTTAPQVTSIPTPVSTPAQTQEPEVTASSTPTSTPSPTTTLAASPPPPGTGSSQTAVLSVIELTGTNLATFNNDLGAKFTAAMSDILGVPASSILIRNWQPASRRRALLQSSDSILVGSMAPFGSGTAAAAGLATLKEAGSSGTLQAAFRKENAQIQQASLQSAQAVVPSNFQPLGSSQGSTGGLKIWAWILVAIAGVLVILTILLCCCRSCLCCCCPSQAEEERLPNMIKYGQKDIAQPYFYNDQTFTRTPNLVHEQKAQTPSNA